MLFFLKNTKKGLLNIKKQTNGSYFIDQLINKYYISSDMNEVLNYISWRSPPFIITGLREQILEILNEREKY